MIFLASYNGTFFLFLEMSITWGWIPWIKKIYETSWGWADTKIIVFGSAGKKVWLRGKKIHKIIFAVEARLSFWGTSAHNLTLFQCWSCLCAVFLSKLIHHQISRWFLSIPLMVPQACLRCLRLFSCLPPLYLIWEKFEIGKTLNFGTPPRKKI